MQKISLTRFILTRFCFWKIFKQNLLKRVSKKVEFPGKKSVQFEKEIRTILGFKINLRTFWPPCNLIRKQYVMQLRTLLIAAYL